MVIAVAESWKVARASADSADFELFLLVTQPHDVAVLGSQVRNLLSLSHYDDHRKFPGEE